MKVGTLIADNYIIVFELEVEFIKPDKRVVMK